MNLAEAIQGMLNGKTLKCTNDRNTEYKIIGRTLYGKDDIEKRWYDASLTGEVLRLAVSAPAGFKKFDAYFLGDMVAVPLAELTAMKKRIEELERGAK